MRQLRLPFALVPILILSGACSSTPKQSKPAETPTYWEWAGSKGGGTSEQFYRDKYACVQDYRQTASPYTQRDPVTEMKFMTLHTETCLMGKGWKQVADISRSYWTPSGWVKLPAGTTRRVWYWKGQPVYEENAQWKQDSGECDREAGIVNRKNIPKDQLEVWYACLWKKDWKGEPIRQDPAVQSSAKLYWRPSGWMTAPSGTKKIEWVWKGAPSEEAAALKRFDSDKTNCLQDLGISDPRSPTAQQGKSFMACMWEKEWGQEPF